MKRIIIPLALLATSAAYSQVGIGTLTPNNSAQLEVVAQDKGILIPRVKLTSTTDATTITSGNVNSLLVFNTETIADITPGYYYWYINKWYRILADGEGRINDTFTLVGNNLVLTDNKGHQVQVDLSALRATETLTILKYEPTNGELSYQDEQGNISNVDLKQVVNNYQTLTTLVYDQTTGLLTYKDEQGNTHPINLTQIIKEKETLTILSFEVTTGILSYKDEDGVTHNINLSGLVPANETLTSVKYDNTTGLLEYKDEKGASTLINLKQAVKDNETLTALSYDAATGKLTYKPESGANQEYIVGNVTNLNFNPTTGKITYTDPTGPKEIDLPTQIKQHETLTSINYANGTLTYNPERGNPQVFTISAIKEIKTSATPGNIRIVNVDGTEADIPVNETVTKVEEIKNAKDQLTGFKYTDERGVEKQINFAQTSLVYNNTTGNLTYTPTYGEVQIINIKAKNIPFDPVGTITATNVQDAIKELDDKIATGAAQRGNITGVGTDPIIKVTDGDNAALKNVTLDINAKSIDADKLKPSGNAGQVLKVVDNGAGGKEVQYSTLTNADINSTATIQGTGIKITKDGVNPVETGSVLKNVTLEIADNAITNSKIADKAVSPNKIDSQGVAEGQVLTAKGDGSVEYREVKVLTSNIINPVGTTVNNGQVLKFNTITGKWEPSEDKDTTYVGSTSVVLNGSSFEREALTGDVTANRNSNQLTIAQNAVTSEKIANGTIQGEDIKDKTIGADKLNPTGDAGQVLTIYTDPVTGNKEVRYQNPSVSPTQITNKQAITTDGKILVNNGNNLADAVLAATSLSIAQGAIGTNELANNAITSEKIKDGEVKTTDLADKAVTADKLGATPADANKVPVVQPDGSVIYQNVSTQNLSNKGNITGEGITVEGGDASALKDVKLSIADGAITEGKIAAGAVTNTKLGADAVTSEKIKDGEVKTNDLADNAVTSAKIQDGEVKESDLANDAVTSEKIKDGEVKEADLATNAVTTEKIKDKAVTTNKIDAGTGNDGKVLVAKADGTVSFEKPTVASGDVSDKKGLTTDGKILLNGATSEVKSLLADVRLSIANGAITSNEIADGTIDTADIKGDAITSEKIANNTIQSEDIKDKAVTANKLGANPTDAGKVPVVQNDGSVTYQNVPAQSLANKKTLNTDGKILVNGVNTLADAVLEEARLTIAQGAIGTNELAADAVTSEKIKDGEVKTNDLANNAVDNTKLADNTVTSDKIKDGEVKTNDLADNAVETVKIKDSAVTAEKLNAGTGNEGKVPVAKADGSVTYENLPAQNLGNKKAITTDDKILVNNTTNLADAVLVDTRLSIKVGSIGTTELTDRAVTADKLADGAVTEGKLATDAVTTDKIKDGNVTEKKLVDNAVTSDKIKDGEVKTQDLANGAITTEKILNNNVTTEKLADNAVTTEKIKDKAVTAEKLADNIPANKITGEKLSTDAIINASVVDNKVLLTALTLSINNESITSDKIKNGEVKTDDLATDAVTENKIKDNAVTTNKIGNGQVTPEKLSGNIPADKIVTKNLTSNDITVTNGTGATLTEVTLAIKDGAITESKLANDAVSENKIKNDAVTTTKIKDSNVTESKLATDAVTTNKIKDGAVTPEKLSGNIPADKITGNNLTSTDIEVTGGTGTTLKATSLAIKANAITEDKIATNAVTTDKIKDNAVTGDKIADNSITKNDLATNSVSTEKIENKAVTADKLADDIPASKIKGETLTLGEGLTFATGNGTGLLLKPATVNIGQIDGSKIKDGTVSIDKLNATGVENGKVATVENGKVVYKEPAKTTASGSITSTDITVNGGDNSTFKDVTLTIKEVDGSKIKDATITKEKIASVDGSKIENSTITNEKIQSIEASKVTSNATVKGENGVVISGNATGSVLKDVTIGLSDVPVDKIKTTAGITSPDNSVEIGGNATASVLKDVTLKVSNIAADKITSGTINKDRLPDNIPGSKIENNTITNEKISDVDGSKIVTNSIDPDKIKSANITSPDGSVVVGNADKSVLKGVTLAVGNIDGGKITSGTINKDRLPSDIPGSKIESNSITPEKIQKQSLASQDQSITVNGGANSVLNAVDLSINKVDGSKITNNTIDLEKLKASTSDNGKVLTVEGGKVVYKEPTAPTTPAPTTGTGSITSTDITVTGGSNATFTNVTLAINSVDGSKITSNSITNDKIQSVDGSKIVDNSITNDKIRNINGSKIDNNTITNDKIQSINGGKIVNNTITNDKIQSINGGKIESNSITNDKIQSVNADKISSTKTISGQNGIVISGTPAGSVLKDVTIGLNNIDGSKIQNNTITSDKISSINGSKIDNNSITPEKINSDKSITAGDNIEITGTPAGSVLKDVTIAVKGKDLSLGKALKFADGKNGTGVVLKETEIDLKVGTSIDARENNNIIKVTERKRSGATAEEMLVIDANGEIQKMKFRRQQFYMPSVVLPTQPFDGTPYGANTTYNSGTKTFTINLYAHYQSQFTNSVISSNASAKLEIFNKTDLDYFIVYLDDNVVDRASVSVSADGVLTYKVKDNAVESEKTFMNIVFQEKD